MDWLWTAMKETDVFGWETFMDDWFFVFSATFLLFEFTRYLFKKKMSWSLLGDSIVNYLTLFMFIFVNLALLAVLYVSAYSWASQIAVFNIGINWATIAVCIILADLAYYWEHRFMHRVNLLWATHSVHHSSPHFNISVAYRFGPMDGVWPILFHLPLVLLGFNPFVVFFAEKFVQLFQTALHTEVIRKFPRPIEAVFNTPSHHRVHHASNQKYLDSNYAGIFIIWDRMFGTFVREDEKVVYGLVKPIKEIKTIGDFLAAPFIAFFHGFWRLGRNVITAKGFKNKWMYVFATPEWKPDDSSKMN